MLKTGILLLKESFATDYFIKAGDFLTNRRADKVDDFLREHFDSKVEATNDIYKFDGLNAHIQIKGPMSEDGPDLFDIFYGYGGVAYPTISEAIDLAREDVDPSQGTVYFHMNTPGGGVDGCDAVRQGIDALSIDFNTVAVNHGDIASAGMWLASGCGRIVAATPVAFTGSIGVVVSTYDISEMLKSMGVKKVVITNHEASEKRPDISTVEGQKLIQQELDAIYQVFVDRVTAGRKNLTKEIIDNLKGSVKVASEALDIGLIDAIRGAEQPPAVAGQPEEEASMGLVELLAANPKAKAEHEALIASAKAKGEADGKTAGMEQMKGAFKAALPILSSGNYPETVKTRVATKAEAGDVEGLKDFVALHDMNVEQQAQNDANGEQNSEETLGEQDENLTSDGVVKDAAGIGAAVASFNETNGGAK